MRRLIANGFVFVSVAILCVGCTSYSSEPTINEHIEPGTKEAVSSFSYAINSPWKNSRLGKDAYVVTQKVIPDALDNSASVQSSARPALEIKISEFSMGGACAQEYLTGLSLGLIPSWCTRSNLLKFNFVLNKDNGFCREKTYSIGSTSFSHLILIPFSIFEADNQPLSLYQAALKDFLQRGPCTTP
jgi:hypothetical protein